MKRKHLTLYAALATAACALPAVPAARAATTAQDALAAFATSEAPRVTRAVDGAQTATLGRTHLAAVAATAPVDDLADAAPMNHLQLVLKRSPQRQARLDALLAAQHDPASPLFHRWLTPEQYGATFGVADADIAAARAWLAAQGFKVNGVYPNKMQIDFSGTAGQVKKAFRTQESHYLIAGGRHVANRGDISVPAALEDVVAGVAGLNDLRPQAQHVAPRLVRFDPGTQRFKPLQGAGANTAATATAGTATAGVAVPASVAAVGPDAVSFVNGARGLVPYDLAKMYGVDKLRKQGITGRGVTIAVVEDGSMVADDWNNFVEQFSLGSYGGSFSQVQPQAAGLTNCIDPTIAVPGEDDGETLLDAEWATAIAPGAHVEVASCDDSNSNNFFGGVFTAAENLINGDERPDVISASYGYGEAYTDAASKAAIDQMWAQADVEGISVFVSTGDSGADPSFNGGVINGVGIDANSLATSANVTGVGGTDTADVLDGTTAQYFKSKANAEYGTALSYVPEIPWNESCGNPVAAKAAGFASVLKFCQEYLTFDPEGYYVTSEGGSGGPSSVVRKPAWQRLVYNAARDQSRDLPDVSLFAGSYGGDTWVITCTAAYPCAPGWPGSIAISGGTSLSSPMFAGIQALIDQGLAERGLPQDQGNAAPTLYALAAQEYGGPGSPAADLAACSADNGADGTGKCVFHNVTRGGISTQCYQEQGVVDTPDCYIYGTLQTSSGPLQLGLLSTSTAKYNQKLSAYPAQPGWSFAAGLGSVNATRLLAAWKKFVDAP
jgi:subtilase family serine protease